MPERFREAARPLREVQWGTLIKIDSARMYLNVTLQASYYSRQSFLKNAPPYPQQTDDVLLRHLDRLRF